MEIHWRDPHNVDAAERARSEEHLERLATGHTDLIDVWLDFRTTAHHRHGGDEITIRALVRGGEVVARRVADSPKVALRDALDAFEREIRRMREARATPPRAGSVPPLLGIVERVVRDRDFGFLLTDAGEQVYFHRNALRDELAWETIQEGQRVALEVEAGLDGPQATVVAPPPPDATSP
jgi:cold shock CspA family protein/ribosome-associated translation inhibitor RaiA